MPPLLRLENVKNAREARSRMRLIFRSALAVAFVGCVAVATVKSRVTASPSSKGAYSSLRRLGSDDEDDEDESGTCAVLEVAGLQILVMVMGVLYMFVALAIVCDEFFVPALEVMSERLEMKDDVAGATLMAAGGSAPELFTSLIGTFNRSDVGIGTIVGSAVFNVLFVIGMCAIFSKELLKLTWWPLFRDCCWYMLALALVGGFFANGDGSTIEWWEALILLLVYFGYVGFMSKNEEFEVYFKTKVLPPSWGLSAMADAAEGEAEGGDDSANKGFVAPTRFRAGILTLLLQDSFDIDNLGVHLVANITGAAAEVFKRIDVNGDGELEPDEIEALLREAKLDSSPASVRKAAAAMLKEGSSFGAAAAGGDATSITCATFTRWYLQCEERMKQLVEQSFQECDLNANGALELDELVAMVLKLTGRDLSALELAQSYAEMGKVDGAALGAKVKACGTEAEAMTTAKATLEDISLNFDEFKEWYYHSLFWTERKEALKAAAEEEDEGAMGPFSLTEMNLAEQCKYVYLWPLVASLDLSLCDPKEPGKEGYCYYVFAGSIAWIGVYSYLMVTWATVIGATIGIPDLIMGLTFLAAGTSVPDLLSSVIVARQGLGDMAVSSSIGSNIFDVTVGLPFPWLLFCAGYGSVTVSSDGVAVSIFILLGMLATTVGLIMGNGWALTKLLGYSMFALYFVYVIQELIRAALTGGLSDTSC